MYVRRCLSLLLQLLLLYLFTLVTVNIVVHVFSDIFINHTTIYIISLFFDSFTVSLCITNIAIRNNIIFWPIVLCYKSWRVAIDILTLLFVIVNVNINVAFVALIIIFLVTNICSVATISFACQMYVCLIMINVINYMYIRHNCLMFSFHKHFFAFITIIIIITTITIIAIPVDNTHIIFVSVIVIDDIRIVRFRQISMLMICYCTQRISVIIYWTLWVSELMRWCNKLWKAFTIRWVVN